MPGKVIHKSNRSPSDRHRRSRAAQLLSSHPLLRGSLSVRKIRCGKPNCKCASGHPHLSFYLVQTQNGKARQLYIPKELEPQVRQAVDNYQHLQDLIEQLSQIEWERLIKAKQEDQL